jgi:pimeloyl-ACP methyl ester carboxylesterase
MDAPSDHRSILGVNGWHGSHIFRLSPKHARDIGAGVAYLKHEKLRPVWLVGIRMGAFSATTAAIQLQQEVAGLVIAGGITRCPQQHILLQLCPSGLMGMPLHEITIPTLILSGGETFPDPLLSSALSHAPNIRFQTFPEFASFEDWGGWDATRTVLPGVSNAQVSREVADFMQWHARAHPVLRCDKSPEDMAPLEIYLAYCYF